MTGIEKSFESHTIKDNINLANVRVMDGLVKLK